jgi:hypothetical protein
MWNKGWRPLIGGGPSDDRNLRRDHHLAQLERICPESPRGGILPPLDTPSTRVCVTAIPHIPAYCVERRVRPCIYAVVLGLSHQLSGPGNLIMWAKTAVNPLHKVDVPSGSLLPSREGRRVRWRPRQWGMTYQVRRCIVLLTGSRVTKAFHIQEPWG